MTAAAAGGEVIAGLDLEPLPPRRRRLIRPRGKSLAGLALLGLFVVMAIIGPFVAPYDPSATSAAILRPPSGAHLLGTTQTGQDVLSQLLVGCRVTLLVGVAAGVVSTALAVLIGVTAGYLGGIADEGLSALSNIFLVLPALPLVIVLAGYLKGSGPLSVAVVISVTGWAFGARVLRAQTLSLRERDFVKAARVRGENVLRIVVMEILPNELGIVISALLLTTVFAILTAASLAFLGLGSLSSWSWGTMLYWAQNAEAFTIGAWWWYVPPGICIALVGTALGLLNLAIDERLNPRLRYAQRSRRRARPAASSGADVPALTSGADA
jgi:peptide/nickel transport system permease protein